MKKIMFWVPRTIMILFILLISMFALDAFDGDASLIKKIAGFLIHLIPTFILIILLVLSWKREWIGVFFCPLLGLLYIFLGMGKISLVVFFIISGPLFISGILFMVNWINRKSYLKTKS
jgi:hypothetical protein